MSTNSAPVRFDIKFPHASTADENDVVALSKELTPSLVLSAYIRGIFPWHITLGRVFWYSPDPRAILYPSEIKISKSLEKTIKSEKYEVRVNNNFSGVITNCSHAKRAKQDGTWISEEFIDCYTKLHNYGFALSIESYHEGLLVGGLYGLKLGGIFFGESMFAHKSDASKVALAYLCENAKEFGIKLIDCQQATTHLLSLGAEEMRRTLFTTMLEAEFAMELGL